MSAKDEAQPVLFPTENVEEEILSGSEALEEEEEVLGSGSELEGGRGEEGEEKEYDTEEGAQVASGVRSRAERRRLASTRPC